MTPSVVLTFDTDWAPEWMLESVAERLEDSGTPSTWFVTHAAPVLERLRARPDLFELGIHPNFRAGSTHGSTPQAVLEHVRALVPEAISTRSHGLVQSGELYATLAAAGLRIDASTFLPGAEHVRPLEHPTAAGPLVRVPFVWSDDHEPLRASPSWDLRPRLSAPGLHVLLFHPLRVCLNITDAAGYAAAQVPPPVPVDPPAGPGPAAALDALLASGLPAARLRDVAGL